MSHYWRGLQSKAGWEVTGLAVPAPQAFQSKKRG